MFNMLANVYHQVTEGEALPPHNHFWYKLPDLPSSVRRVAESFEMELEHLVIHEAPWSPIRSGTAGADAPSLCAFFMTLQGSNPKYGSHDAWYDAMPHE